VRSRLDAAVSGQCAQRPPLASTTSLGPHPEPGATVPNSRKANAVCAGPALADAESALEYAHFEAERDGPAFASEHADLAVEKAETARAGCRARQ
jgi:hypothetical protein